LRGLRGRSVVIAFGVAEVLFVLGCSTTKISMFFSSLRLFRPNEQVKRVCWVMLGVNGLSCLPILAISLCQCGGPYPTSAPFILKKCSMSIEYMWLWNAITFVVADIAFLGIAILGLWKLQVTTSKKLGVLSWLSIGVL